MAGRGEAAEDFHAWMRALSAKEDSAVIDLVAPLETFQDDITKICASPFDAHPNAAAPAHIAGTLYDRMRELWPALLHPVPVPG